jgi:cytochrome c2
MAVPSKRKQLWIWTSAAVLAIAGLVVVLVRGHHPAGVRRAVLISGSPEKGAALFYGDKQCGICHAVNGKGGRLAPDLAGLQPSPPALGWLTAVMWNHAPGMWRQMRRQGIPRLNQEEVAHILAFLYKAGTSDRMGSAQKGRRVFTDKGCVRCHSVGSSGGDRAPELSEIVARAGTIAWMGAMWNHAQSMVEPVTKEMGRWPELDRKSVV